MSTEDKVLNGVNITQLLRYIEKVRNDPTLADRNPTLVAHWVGESRSRIEFRKIVTHIGGEGELNPMMMLLSSYAACQVDLVVLHASFLGLKIKSLSVEAAGHFDVRRYLGFDDAPGPGYDKIVLTVRIRAPGATPEQVAHLRENCERSCPVGDSLAQAIPLKLEIEADSS